MQSPEPSRPCPDSVQDIRAELTLLLGAIGSGDRSAFDQLYRAVAPPLKRYTGRLMSGWGCPDEVLQEAFLAIWHGAARYDALRAPPMIWLRAIVRNQVLDTYRRQSARLPGARDEFDPGMLASPLPLPCQQIESAQQLVALRGWLASLGAEQRHAIELTWFQELSHRQAAAHMNKPLGTVKTLVRRGLIALRAQSAGASMLEY